MEYPLQYSKGGTMNVEVRRLWTAAFMHINCPDIKVLSSRHHLLKC